MEPLPGSVVIFGSGETAPASRAVYAWAIGQLTPPLHLSVLETPAGFEPNSAQTAGRVAEYLSKQFADLKPHTHVVPARQRGTPFSPDDPGVVAPLFQSNFFHLGAGSPTYAARQLRGSLAWEVLQARHRLGAAVVFASAGAIAAGTLALPVYEIYKAGADLHWQPGLDFFGAYGLNLVIVSHWNNRAGGADLDTSRCFMGEERFGRLQALLPRETVVLGVDEHTALVMALAGETCRVAGLGGVSIVRAGEVQRFESGAKFAVDVLGPYRFPRPEAGLWASVWRQALAAAAPVPPAPGAEVQSLLEQREQLRASRDWAGADHVRERLLAQGWHVEDTPGGPRVRRLP